MTESIVKELEGIPEEIEKVILDPISKPLVEFREAVKSLLRDNSAETEYLTTKEKRLKDLLDLGIYEDSVIAQRYADVLEIYKRLFLIFTKYTEVADESIKKIKKIVEKNYISLERHETILQNKLKYYSGLKKGPGVKDELKQFDEFVEKEKKKKPKKERKPNPWLEHLDKVRKENPDMPVPEAATLAKETYKKKENGG